MTTTVSGSYPAVNSDSDATINGLTVGKGGGAISTNTAVGLTALNSNTTGSANTAVGYRASFANTTGIVIDAFGYASLEANTTGQRNAAFGAGALGVNTTGSYNIAVGNNALASNTTASNNTAVGYQAGYKITTGENNTCMGYQAGSAITTGSLNVSVGRLSMDSSVAITGQQNNGFGNGTLRNLTSGSYNNAMGSGAMQATTTGSNNVAVGQNALRENTTASSNTAVGFEAGYNCTTNGSNTLIGASCGTTLTSGTNNTYLGGGATASSAGIAQEVIICTGNGATGKGNNTGFITANLGSIFQGNNSASWATTSDQRLKKNIVDNNEGLDIISQLRVRNFEYRKPEEITEVPPEQAIQKEGIQLGVIAQEIQQVLPECVKQESTGVLSVQTDNLIWYAINAIQELNAKVEAQALEIATLKGN